MYKKLCKLVLDTPKGTECSLADIFDSYEQIVVLFRYVLLYVRTEFYLQEGFFLRTDPLVLKIDTDLKLVFLQGTAP